MTELYRTASGMQEFFRQRNWKFCIIGGVAVLRWGHIRATKDVDITLLTGFGQEEFFVDELLKAGRLRPPCNRESAIMNRVILLTDSYGVPVDVALGAIPFEERTVERSTLWEAEPNLFLRTCSAEDLLVHKCFASRNLDWGDVEGILARQVGKLDLALVRRELKPLVEAKEAPGILERLEDLITHHDQPFTRIKPVNPRKKKR
jgi:hypothetical protein